MFKGTYRIVLCCAKLGWVWLSITLIGVKGIYKQNVKFRSGNNIHKSIVLVCLILVVSLVFLEGFLCVFSYLM